MIYLHHYPASLFSEKIRALLGYYQLTWQSVEISSIMPRPLLMPLSGGYRRTPVLQIDANVYSDTKIICRALARLTGDTGLYPEQLGFAAHRTADWADTTLFRVTVALNFRPEALVAMMGNFSEEEAAAFAKDRAELSGDAPIASLSPQAALAYLDHALTELESGLAGAEFLMGDRPCIADFSVYHNLWFLKNNPVNAPLLDGYSQVQAWYARMAAFGHGDMNESTGDAALQAALNALPELPALTPAPNFAFASGQQVSVTPVDYGCIPVAGELVASDHQEVVIARETPETGPVYNHFPQAGFSVDPVS
ncbi:MAG: glutathione S-transferase family protein [Pseudomonadota bacterium]